MPGRILVDSSFLYALYDQSDAKHPSARAFAQANSDTLVILEVTLPEVAFLVNRAGGITGVLRWLDALIEVQQTFEPILISDIERARSILWQLTPIAVLTLWIVVSWRWLNVSISLRYAPLIAVISLSFGHHTAPIWRCCHIKTGEIRLHFCDMM